MSKTHDTAPQTQAPAAAKPVAVQWSSVSTEPQESPYVKSDPWASQRTSGFGRPSRPFASLATAWRQDWSPAADTARAIEPKAVQRFADVRIVQSSAPREPMGIDRADDRYEPANEVHGHAIDGLSGTATVLPHIHQIQRAFGRHDVSGIKAHIGGRAARASDAMGARAYATGNHVAFREAPDLHTAAHEAAHVVQQRGGVQLKDGVGQAGDRYERHADAVAARVVRGASAESLLGEMAGNSTSSSALPGAVQRDIKGKGSVPMGTFKIDMVNAKDTSTTPSRSGVRGTVSFKPNKKSPDTNSIRMVQIVKVVDLRKKTPADYTWTGGEADRNKMRTNNVFDVYETRKKDTLKSISKEQTGGHITPDEIYQVNNSVLKSDKAAKKISEGTILQLPKVQGGYFVDHLAADPKAAPRTKDTDAEVTPYYRDYAPNASVSQDGFKKGKKKQAASLWDFPGSSFDTRFSFETVARAEGVGIDYGTIHWDFTIESGKIKNESFHVAEGTSETFQAGLTEFNKFYKNRHTVMEGETLRSIAERYYGDEMKWPKIYNANKDVITDPKLIKVGWKLRIPDISA